MSQTLTLQIHRGRALSMTFKLGGNISLTISEIDRELESKHEKKKENEVWSVVCVLFSFSLFFFPKTWPFKKPLYTRTLLQ